MKNKTSLPKHNINDPIAKTNTFIPGFDEISNGGIPQGRTTLVTGTSGSAKTIFAIQFLIEGIRQSKEPAVFVTFEETPFDIIRNVKSFGWDLQQFVNEGLLAFVDCSPEPNDDDLITGDFDLMALLVRVKHAVTKVSAQRISIDSVSALFNHFSDAKMVRQLLFRISAELKSLNLTTVITAERTEDYGPVGRFGVEEFVVDNVIMLRNRLEMEKRRRTIEILKYRGTPHQKGEFPFTISDSGIEVLPLSAMELTQKSSSERLSTGNDELDVMCGGGFYRDSIILVSGATGCGKTLAVTTFIDDGCRRGERTLVFAFEESREQLLRNATAWGKDLQQWEKKGLLKIICAYPEVLGLEDHLLSMKKQILAFDPTRIAMDSLSAMERVATPKSFREFIIGITSFIKSREAAGLFTAVTATLTGGPSVTETHISTITDTILLLRYVELMGEMRRGITVLKMRGSNHDKTIREYEIDDSGMHIGGAFKNVGGILAGSPIQHISGEANKFDEMF